MKYTIPKIHFSEIVKIVTYKTITQTLNGIDLNVKY